MKYIAFIICLLLSNVCHADIEIRSTQILTDNGLANNTVRYFYQDSKGFIWMSTIDGLCRYDGNSFVTLRPDPGQQISLIDQRTSIISEDKNGFLWIATSPELYNCYDLKQDRFVDYTGNEDLYQRYTNVFFAENGDVWLRHSNGNGARLVQYKDGAFSSVIYKKEQNNLPDNHVSFIQESPKNTIWIGTKKGLVIISGNNQNNADTQNDFRFAVSDKTKYIYLITQDNDIITYNILSQKQENRISLPEIEGNTPTGCIYNNDELIVLTTAGIFTYDIRNNLILHGNRLLKDEPKSGTVITDNRGNDWIYNHSGKLWYINKEKNTSNVFTVIPPDKIGYVDYERYSIVHDSRNIIWISTYGNGLFAYHPTSGKMYHYTSSVDGSSPIGADFLHNVFEDRSGAIWVGTDHAGLSVLTVMNEDVKRIYPEDKHLMDRSNTIRMIRKTQTGNILVSTRKGQVYEYNAQMTQILQEHSYPSSIYEIIKDDKGRTWQGSRGNGLCIDNKWYRKNADDATSLTNDNIFHIHQDSKKRMWIATFGGGLDLAIEDSNGNFSFRHFFNHNYSVRQMRVINEDKNGMLWCGCDDGLFVFNPDSLIQDPMKYYHYNYQSGQLKSNEVRALLCDSKGNMWIGTAGSGLSVCKPENNYEALSFQSLTTENGLVNNTVQSLLEDRFNNIWITTEYGISRFHTRNNTFENYSFSIYGLGNAYCENSACMNDYGELIFGSNHGLIVIDPSTLKKVAFSSPIVFTNITVNGIEINASDKDAPMTQSIAHSDQIKLNHTQNTFSIDFSTFNFAESNMTKYSYILENYDKTWSTAATGNRASYKNIHPGEYTLRVRTSNSTGVWDSREAKMQIIITPPFWKTTYAYILYAILISSILYITYRITRNFARLNNKIKLEEQLTNYKLVFFTNISHEFRTPLTLIQGALEKMEQKAEMLPKELLSPLRVMDKSTKRLLRLINQLLEFRKMQNNRLALSLEETDVIAFLKEIFYSFKDVAQSKNMDFRFISSSDNYKMYIDKEKLDKITYNLLSNAFKYTPSGGKITLTVTIDHADKCLRMQISDNGVGIPKEKQGELFNRFMQSSFSSQSIGIGLHLTHELVNVHKGTISFHENDNKGSIFTVTLPLDKSKYKENDFLIPDNILMKEVSNAIQMDTADTQSPEDKEFVKPLNPYKVLIIEDDNEVLRFLKEELSTYFEIDVAEDGKIGLERTEANEYDLIVCDVLMPNMNGFEVTKRLKSNFNTSHIPVILLTALSTQENMIEGFEYGADAYITKPFRIKLLLARIFKLMEQREILRKKYSSEPGILQTSICTNDKDKDFSEKLNLVLEKNMSNAEFSVDDFAQQMKVGRTIFYKKVKGVTGYSPNEYIRIIRMKKAAELLQSGELTISEVSYKVGINDPFYFSKCFKTQFGVAPSVYQKGENSNEPS
ncbi:MAG: response regulator [Tannerella sp.]|jgi:signal transduction histidine kinase/ligand-binding sensor domain-containing protein/DNA-binding response OmpR family regulator|nr:response regulator [Tannerella sp.]